jgi:hypothetical protein
MDPLRHNCTQLYGRSYICRDTVGFKNDSDFFPLSATLLFSNRSISLSLLTNSRREETVDAGPLNHSIGLEEDRWKAKGI